MNFSENFLHFIWQFRLFKPLNLYCTSGEEVRIINTGILNRNAGPDFSNVKLQIGTEIWVGDVEIHLKSSDWLLHGHQNDDAYDSVILHVVYTHDHAIYRRDGSLIPVLVLNGLFSSDLLVNYDQLIHSLHKFPCEKHFSEIDSLIVESVLTRMVVERLTQKSTAVLEKLASLKGDWESTFYCFLAKSFGFKVNEIPFEMLADSLPKNMLDKHRDHVLQVEALLFGQAGFLTGSIKDEYPKQLRSEYLFLQKKYRLKPLPVGAWHFLRMRPQNFPSLRLAQFSALLMKSTHLFSKVMEEQDLGELVKLLQDIPVNHYWANHYHFHKETVKVKLQLGLRSVHHLLINVVCQFLFTYGRYTDQPHLIDRAMNFLEQIPAEQNSIIKWYQASGFRARSAFSTQGILQLNKYHCAQKKCLNCGIGIRILNYVPANHHLF